MSTPPRCSLSVILSKTSPVAIIARRGPSRRCCLIRWDLRNDRFETGHWYKGRVTLNDLSPSGEWLLTTCSKGFDVWTVLSRPPYLTAHGLWHIGDHWGAGGRFLGEDCVVLDRVGNAHGLENIGPYRLPSALKVRLRTPDDDRHPAPPSRWHRQVAARDTQDHAARLDFANGQVVHGPDGLRLERNFYGALRLVHGAGDHTVDLPAETAWADFNPWSRPGQLVFAIEGRLLAVAVADLPGLADTAALTAHARTLADFTGLTFEARPAPASALPARSLARPAKGDDPWHPLDAGKGRGRGR